MDTTRRLITFASVSILVYAGSGTAFLGSGWSGFASTVAGASLNSNSGLTRDSQSLGSTGLKRQQGWRGACNSDAAKRTSPSMLGSVKVSLEFDQVGGFAAMLSFLLCCPFVCSAFCRIPFLELEISSSGSRLPRLQASDQTVDVVD